MELFVLISKVQDRMRKLYKKSARTKDQTGQQKQNPDRQLFQKLLQNFTNLPLRSSQHTKISTQIKQQIKRPQTSTTLRKDYKSLLNLVDCNGMIIESRNRSIMSYKKMRSINMDHCCRRNYQVIFQEVRKTEGNLGRRKFRKYDIAEFQKYMHDKQIKDDSLQTLVESTLTQTLQTLKSQIPQQAQLQKKLTLFGDLFHQQKLEQIEEIKKLLQKQQKKSGPLPKNYQIYLINHYLIEKLMTKTVEDCRGIQVKKENFGVYQFIKREMVGEIIKERKLSEIIHTMIAKQQPITKFKPTPNPRPQPPTPTKAQPSKNQRYGSQAFNELSNKNKENDITVQFEKVYEQARDKITEAQMEFNFPTNRKQNFYSMIQMRKNLGN